MWYFFRVELHDFDDYDSLHKAMAEQGFSRDILVEGAGYRELPTGMYRFKQPVNELMALSINLQQLGLKVQAAASSVHHDYEYVGFNSTDVLVCNLKPSERVQRNMLALALAGPNPASVGIGLPKPDSAVFFGGLGRIGLKGRF